MSRGPYTTSDYFAFANAIVAVPFVVVVRAKLTNLVGTSQLFAMGAVANDTHYFRCSIQPGTGALRFACCAGGGANIADALSGVVVNTWFIAICVAVSSTDRRAYLNADATATPATTNLTPIVDTTSIGVRKGATVAGACAGLIAQVGVWNDCTLWLDAAYRTKVLDRSLLSFDRTHLVEMWDGLGTGNMTGVNGTVMTMTGTVPLDAEPPLISYPRGKTSVTRKTRQFTETVRVEWEADDFGKAITPPIALRGVLCRVATLPSVGASSAYDARLLRGSVLDEDAFQSTCLGRSSSVAEQEWVRTPLTGEYVCTITGATAHSAGVVEFSIIL